MMPLFFVYSDIFIELTFIPSNSSVAIRRGPLHLLIAGQLSGKTLPVVESRESNSGLPYSKPTHYQLSYAAPSELRPTLVKLIAKIPVGGLLVFRIVGLDWLPPVGVDGDANLSSLLSKL
jgi:hypothetical protein